MSLTDTDPAAHDPPLGLKLFPFLRLLAAALARGELTRMQAATATLMAVNSTGDTGLGVTVDIGTMSTEMDISPRQVWRHVNMLIENGWFSQTQKPTRGTKGEGGRRAKYRLTVPRLKLAHDIALAMAESNDKAPVDDVTRNSESNDRTTLDDVTRNRVPEAPSGMSHDFIHSPESCDSFTPNRVTVSRETCDIPERKNGTVLPSDVLPSDVTNSFGNYTNVTTDRANDDDHPIDMPLAKGA